MDPDPTLQRLEQVTVGPVEHRAVVIVVPDPAWPAQFEDEAGRIRGALRGGVRGLHHVGSTAVPGLPAKPIIDIVLVVDDPAEEAGYVPALESIGYALKIREPDWYEHRVLVARACSPDVNLHVFGPGCPEVDRMLWFRDHLRTDPEDRDRYARTKQALARRSWPTVQHYADAKTDVVEQIMTRRTGS